MVLHSVYHALSTLKFNHLVVVRLTAYVGAMCDHLMPFSFPEFAEQTKEEDFPEVFGWVERMKGVEAVKKSYQPPEAHLAFINSVKTGVHDYSHADVTGQGITVYAKKE